MKMSNTRIRKVKRLPSFNDLKKDIPLSGIARETVISSRQAIEDILSGKDKRILLLCGPCSVHDVKEAILLAKKMVPLIKRYRKQFLIVMRFCFDKPRTKNDWPGIASDPWHDGTYDVAFGHELCRRTMMTILDLGVPFACEMLDQNNYHMVSDLVSYAWIGARTVSSPVTRRVASGVSVPLGIKNSNKDDTITEVLNALDTITQPSVFTGTDDDGQLSRLPTDGNRDAHLILRGGKSGPNYHQEYLQQSSAELAKAGYCPKVLIDCSHGNSGGDYTKQSGVFLSGLKRIKNGEPNILGFMIEAYHNGGKQNGVRLGTVEARGKLKPLLSVTDACIPHEQLVALLEEGSAIIS
ncbi:MAG: 3-deoxy-7-phosphoheptulonate synthase [Candidatus Paceibacterota bacterium]